MTNVLLINAHQRVEGIAEGRLNKAFENRIAEELNGRGLSVQHTVLEAGYDIQAEVEKHLWADLVIVQGPIYWFGLPWIYKKYVDEVFTAGMVQGTFLEGDGRTRQDPAKQYGTGGRLQGKKFLVSLTWNAPQEAFGDPSQNLFRGMTVDEVLVPVTANYRFCGAEVLPVFSSHDVFKAPQIENDLRRLKEHLAKALA